MKYRKKPVVIEAVTWYGKYTDPGEWPDWFNEAWRDGTITLCGGGLRIKTLEGDHLANVGDKIIRGVKGELYPCKPDIFDITYAAESEPEPSSHPDTERLDWLVTNREKINNIESHAGGGWTIWWEHTPSSDPEAIAYGEDLRAVIDAARKEAGEKP